MKFVANCNIWLKCYITFRYIVADEKRGSPYLARAIANLKLILEKNIKNRLVYSFLTSTVIFSLFVFTSQINLSLLFSSSIPAISAGIVVLNDLELGFCNRILDLTSNNFIFSFLSFFINILDNKLYIFYPQFIKL